MMTEAARRVAAGGLALGRSEPRVPLKDISSYEGVVPKTVDWRTLGTTELERSLFVDPPQACAAE
jgi:phthalate 4,5-dioxygenase oxygenase subunit